MNNKKIGSDFERETCEVLKRSGFWVHFISPDPATGKQPFDIIAVRNGISYAIDCKTSVSHIFRLGRAEENQLLAFQKWKKCGNSEPFFLVKYNGWAYIVPCETLIREGKADLDSNRYARWFQCNS